MSPKLPIRLDDFIEASILDQSTFLDNAYDGVVCIDRKSRIIFVNGTALRLFGYAEKTDLVGRSVTALMTEFHARQHDDHVAKSLARSTRYVAKGLRRLKGKRADGTVFPIDVHVIRLEMSGEIYFAGFIRDMTEIERQEEELHQALYYDPLTGMPNAHSVARYLDNYFAEASPEPVNLVLLGLDRMHAINTTFGLRGGDTLLKTTARAISKIFDDSLMAGRVRGRHFVVVSRERDYALQRRVSELSNQVSQCFARTLDLPHSHMLATFSGGSIELPRLAQSTEEALKHAELAREAARTRGPNAFIVCRPEDLSKSLNRSTLPFRISEALENKDFQVFIQPKQSLTHGLCVGGECLIRWIHPDGSATPPDEFIPSAEVAGLIGDIGAYVFRVACDQIKRLSQEHGSLKFSVNTSPIELRDPTFYNRVVATIEDVGIRPDQIEIEITETAMTRFSALQLETLSRLRTYGISISLDDFGTGTSSLANLATLPVDRVKLDRSFVENIETNSSAYILVKHAIEIARDLGKLVTVEGVESFEVRELVRLLGADEIQGFFYAKPKTLHAFEEFLLTEGQAKAENCY